MYPKLYEQRLLKRLGINVLIDICDILKLEIRLISKYLERVLISRDKNRTQQTILYGFLNVIVTSRFGESSREMRFNLSPPPGSLRGRGDPGRPVITDDTNSSSDFNQWLHAMKMVARLPGGMPPEFRRKLWLALADKYLKSKNVDWEKEEIKCFSEQWREDDEELGIQIVKDLHRTGSSLCSGPAGTINQAKLKRILLGYARYNPEVGYCQGFNMLGALILQVMDKEEIESIKVMIYLVEGILPSGYFSGSLGGLQADMAVFRELMTCKLPRLAKHLQKLQGPVENAFEPPLTNVFTMQWFLTMFCTCLPMTCVLRVWDLVLIEGSDVLLRTALVLWSLLEERILNARTADDFYCKMGSFSSELLNGHLIDSNGLIEKVVDLGPIPELQKLRDKHLYNISPFRDKKGLQLYYSDEEGDSDEDSRMAVATAWGLRLSRRGSTGFTNKTDGKDRIALDISLLKKQYDRLRERQRQAHIILTSAVARQGSNPNQSSIQMNQLLIGRNAIVTNNGRRLGPPQGAIPPARKPSLPNAKSPKAAQTKPLRRGETLHWRDTDLSKRRRASLKWKDIKSDSSQSGQDDRPSQLVESTSSSRSSSSEPKSQRASLKARQRSDSSSYSEDSDGNSSTSTSLCDEDDHEVADTNVSSLEGSPMKKSKSSKKHSEVPRKKCLEDVLNSNENKHTVDSQIPFIQLTTIDSPVLNANKTDIDSLEYGKEDSETESNRLDYAGFVDEYSWPDINEAASSGPLEDITVDVTSDEGDFLSLSNVITSTSQLSPIPDITTYINNSSISPLRTPISAFDYANLVVSIDDSRKFDVNDEGVTNEYFERINIVERPTKLDLLYSLNEEDSIRNAYKIESCDRSPEQPLHAKEFPKEKPSPESSKFLSYESGSKTVDPSTEVLDRKMQVLLEYSNQSSLSFIAEAKHEISTGMFKEQEFDPKSLKYQPSTLIPSKSVRLADRKPTIDETIEHIYVVPSVVIKSRTISSSNSVENNETESHFQRKPKVDEGLSFEIETEKESSGLSKPLVEGDLKIQLQDELKNDFSKLSLLEKESDFKTEKHITTKAQDQTLEAHEIAENASSLIPSTEDLETRFRALEMNFSDKMGPSSIEYSENENKSQPNANKTRISKPDLNLDQSIADEPLKTPILDRQTTEPQPEIKNQDLIQLNEEKESEDISYTRGKAFSDEEQQPLVDTLDSAQSSKKQSIDDMELDNLISEQTVDLEKPKHMLEQVHDIISYSHDHATKEANFEKSITGQAYDLERSKIPSFKENSEMDQDQAVGNKSPISEQKTPSFDGDVATSHFSYSQHHFRDKITSQSKLESSVVSLSSSVIDKQTNIPHSYSKILPENILESKEEKLPIDVDGHAVTNTEGDVDICRLSDANNDGRLTPTLLKYSEDHFGEKSSSQARLDNLVVKEQYDSLVAPTESRDKDKSPSQPEYEKLVQSDAVEIPSTEYLEPRFMAVERQLGEKTIPLPKDNIDSKTTTDQSDKLTNKESVLIVDDILPVKLTEADSKLNATSLATTNPDAKVEVLPKSSHAIAVETKVVTPKPIPSTADLEHRFRELERKLSSNNITLSTKTTAPQQEEFKVLGQSSVTTNPSIVLPNNEDATPIDASDTPSTTNIASMNREEPVVNNQPPFIRKRIPSTEDLETRFEALEIQKSLKSPTTVTSKLLSPSQVKVEFPTSAPELDIISKRKSDIPSTEDLENRFQALEQSKVIQKPSKEAQIEKSVVAMRTDGIVPSTKDLETRFETLEHRKSVIDCSTRINENHDSKDEQESVKIPSTQDLETRFEILEQNKSSCTKLQESNLADENEKDQEHRGLPTTADLETRYEALEKRKSKEIQSTSDFGASENTSEKTEQGNKKLSLTQDLENRFEALEHQKPIKSICSISRDCETRTGLETSNDTPEKEEDHKKIPSTQDLIRFEALDHKKEITDGCPKIMPQESVLSKDMPKRKEQDAIKVSIVPSTQDLETRFEALEHGKAITDDCSKIKPQEAIISKEMSNEKEEAKKVPSTRDLETRFEALEQQKLIKDGCSKMEISQESTISKDMSKRKEQEAKKLSTVPSTQDLENRFEALKQQKSITDVCTKTRIQQENKNQAVSDMIILKDRNLSKLPSTQDLETRFEALEQKKITDGYSKIQTSKENKNQNLSVSKELVDKKGQEGKNETQIPSTQDLETRFEALEHHKSSCKIEDSHFDFQAKFSSKTSQETQTLVLYRDKPQEPEKVSTVPSTKDLETRFAALEQQKSITDSSSKLKETEKLKAELVLAKKIPNVPSTQDLETRFAALEKQKSIKDGCCKEIKNVSKTKNTTLLSEHKMLSKVPSTHDLEKRFDEMQIDAKKSKIEQINSKANQKQVSPKKVQSQTDDCNHHKRNDLYKLESQSDETLTATDQTSTEFDAKTESRPTSCPEYREPFDSNIVTTDRVLKIIEENSKILHRILKKTLADTGDMETNSQPKKSHPGITDSLLALGNIFPRTDETILPSRLKSHSWIRPSITLRSDDNISDRLASIKSTIKSIDTLCEEKSFRKEKCQRYIDSLFARPTIKTASPEKPSIKIDDFERKPSQERVAKRELKKETSPRRRRDEEREEYESRVRRDMMPNSIDTPSDLSFSLASIEQVDSEVDRINQGKQVNIQIERPLSPYYVPGYDLNKRSITPVIYTPTKLEIRHTTVTSTFYDRYLTEKHIERTFPRSKKSPVSPTITKSYLDISKYSSMNANDRSSKSAENSPSRRKDGDETNETVPSATNKCNLVSTLEVAQKDLHIRSCDNILLQLRSPANSDIVPSIMVYNPLPTKIRKPSELGISLGLYKDYGSDESSKS